MPPSGADASRAGRFPKWLPRPVRIVVGAIVVTAALAAMSLPVLWLTRLGERAAPVGLQQRLMPDGTVLVLEKVTAGGAHEFEWHPSDWFGLPAPTGNSGRAGAGAPPESIVLWFARFDPATRKSLDFDWWGRAAGIDDEGYEVDADEPGRECFSPHAYSGGSRISGRKADPSGEKWELIVAHSAIPPFRHEGESFKFRVYDRAGAIAAEFDVPHHPSDNAPDWVPDSLPVTKRAGGIDVTLSGLTAQSSIRESAEAPRWSVRPQLALTRDGQPALDLFEIEEAFEDAFGSPSGKWDFRLSAREPAWKLKMKLWPKGDDVADAASEWHVGKVAIPGAGAATNIGLQSSIQGVTIQLAAIGGPGSVSYKGPPRMRGNRSHGGRFEGKDFELGVEEKGTNSVKTVESPMPHLVLSVSGLDADHRLVVRVKDDQGRVVPVHQETFELDTVVLMKTEADASAVDVTLAVIQPAKVEFLVEPPREMRESLGRARESLRGAPEIKTGPVIAWIPGEVSGSDFMPVFLFAGAVIGAGLIRAVVRSINRLDTPRSAPVRALDPLQALVLKRTQRSSRSRELGCFLRQWFGPDQQR